MFISRFCSALHLDMWIQFIALHVLAPSVLQYDMPVHTLHDFDSIYSSKPSVHPFLHAVPQVKRDLTDVAERLTEYTRAQSQEIQDNSHR